MIDRRRLLTRAALAPVATVLLVTQDSEEQEILRLWRMLPDNSRAFVHDGLRAFNGLEQEPSITKRWQEKPFDCT